MELKKAIPSLSFTLPLLNFSWLVYFFLVCLVFASSNTLANSNIWVGPLGNYVNLLSSDNNIDDTQPQVIFADGNPPGDVEVQDNIVASISPVSDAVEVLVSIDGVNWYPAIQVEDVFEYDFGVLEIGKYTLYISVDGIQAEPESFEVIPTIVIPERVSSIIAPNKVGVNEEYQRVWEATSDADYYRLEIVLGDGTETLVEEHDFIVDTAYTLSHSDVGYYWVYLYACNSAGCGDVRASILNVVERGSVPDFVGEMMVPEQAYVGQSIKLQAPEVPGATYYRITMPNIASAEFTTTQLAYDTQYIAIFDPGFYYVYMSACNDNGCGVASEYKIITIVANLDDGTGVPEQVSVFDGYLEEEVEANWWFEVYWDEVPYATSYNIIKWYDDESSFEVVEGVTDNFDYINLSEEGDALIRIQSCYLDICSDWSGEIEVNVGADLPNPVTSLTGPSVAYTDEAFNLTWSSAYNADEYKVLVNGAKKATTDSTSASIALSSVGEKEIFISACNENGCIASSTSLNLVVSRSALAPIANSDSYEIWDVKAVATLDVLANDSSPQSLSVGIYKIEESPQFGSVTVSDDDLSLSYKGASRWCVSESDYIFYDTFKYSVIDVAGYSSEPATVEVKVNCASDESWLQLPVNYTNGISDYAFYIGQDAYYVQLSLADGATNSIKIYLQDGVWQAELVENAELLASIVSGPIEGAIEEFDTIGYGYNDEYYSANIQLDLTAEPIANDDSYSYFVSQSVELDVTINDLGPDELTVSISDIVMQPAFGAVTVNSSSNTISYIPNDGNCSTDSFSYQITNNNGLQDEATVVLNCVQPATAVDDVSSYIENTPVVLDVLANDIEVSGEGVSIIAVTQPAYGSVTFTSETLTFTPSASDCVAVSFSYQIQNQSGDASANVSLTCVDTLSSWSIDTVSVGQPVVISWSHPEAASCSTSEGSHSVSESQGSEELTFYAAGEVIWQCYDEASNPVGDAAVLTVSRLAVAVDDVGSYIENTPVVLDVLANDIEVSGEGVSIIAVTQPAYGSVTFTSETLTFTPSASDCVAVSFSYQIQNQSGDASANVSLTCVDTLSSWSIDTVSVGQPVVISWSHPEAASCSTSEGSHSVSESQGSEELTFYAAGEVIWQCYDEASNPVGDAAVLTVSRLAVAVDDVGSYIENTPVVLDVLANDIEVSGEGVSIIAVTQPAYGSVIFTSETLTFTPSASDCVAVSFSYQIQNQISDASASVSLTCVDTLSSWSIDTVSVGQPVVISWSHPEAASCSTSEGSHSVSESQGSEELTFYAAGEVIWQCYDEASNPVGDAAVLTVNKLAASSITKQ